ncbi:pectate lyase [Powellomyces hirtus]|nr:pectate lyase [Powellomyces hirtus]
MHFTNILAGAAVFLSANAMAAPTNVEISARQSPARMPTSFDFPTAEKNNVLEKARVIKAGTTFDGKMESFDRGVACEGQGEGGSKDTVFLLEDGATLKNVIIGKNQREGVYCLGACTIENVWWTEVCEDALSVKGKGNAYIIGGGARNAKDKVIQHNGQGHVSISGFTVQNFGKLYRSCGNCKSQNQRTVSITNVLADKGKLLAGINTNFGDVATISNVKVTKVKGMCDRFTGTTKGEPKKIGSGPDDRSCIVR